MESSTLSAGRALGVAVAAGVEAGEVAGRVGSALLMISGPVEMARKSDILLRAPAEGLSACEECIGARVERPCLVARCRSLSRSFLRSIVPWLSGGSDPGWRPLSEESIVAATENP